MSKIDRVLIRAFHGSLPGGDRPTPPSPAVRADAPEVLNVGGFSMVGPDPTVGYVTTESLAAVDAAYSDAAYPDAAYPDTGQETYQVIPSDRRLNEFVTGSRQAQRTVGLQSAWEVDRFSWPAIVDDLSSSVSDSVDRLLQVMYASPDYRHVVGLTSYRRGEGRTTTACVVARQAGRFGLRVALVDANRENPSLSGLLGIQAARGWSDALERVGSVAIDSVEDRLTVIPCTADSAADNWQPSRLIDELQHEFDLVIIDAPTVVTIDGSAWHQDSAPSLQWIVVHDSRVTSAVELAYTQKKLQAEGLVMLGVARNFAA